MDYQLPAPVKKLPGQTRPSSGLLPGEVLSALQLREKSVGKSVGKSVTFPSNSALKIVQVADRIFEQEVEWGKSLPKTQNLFLYLTLKVMRILDVNSLFPSLKEHVLNLTPINSEIHTVSLVKLLVFGFFKFRCLSYLKLLNQKREEEPSIRNSILKQIQFKGM